LLGPHKDFVLIIEMRLLCMLHDQERLLGTSRSSVRPAADPNDEAPSKWCFHGLRTARLQFCVLPIR
jgi:hypothetical protein